MKIITSSTPNPPKKNSGDKWGHKGKANETVWNNDMHFKAMLENEENFFSQMKKKVRWRKGANKPHQRLSQT